LEFPMKVKRKIKYKTTAESLHDDETVYRIRDKGKLNTITRSYKLIDLFSGAGGLTLGFTETMGQVFQPVWANDNNKYAADTYNLNFGNHCITGDIAEIIAKDISSIPKADIVIGGPPCQGFSLLNKNRHEDPRKQLWRPFLDVTEYCGAEIFLMENVPQLLDSDEHKEIISVASSMGFKLASAKLCAADYGVPQVRWRAFILGCKFADPKLFFPPKKTHFKPNGNTSRDLFSAESRGFVADPLPWRTVQDAIFGLSEPEGTEIRLVDPPLDLHFGRSPTAVSLARYRAIPKEGMNRFDLQKLAPELTPNCWIKKEKGGTDLFGRLWWDRPAFTIRTEFFKPEKGRYLHPSQHRPITHREAARLQSFPDSFRFFGSKIEIAKQTGNAVPPALAARIADSILALIASKESISYDRQIYTCEEKRNHVRNKRAGYGT
jgi:DNA (cytosine-5)-methyltransferase 1